jgi:RND family efflux transporter MFP subunit
LRNVADDEDRLADELASLRIQREPQKRGGSAPERRSGVVGWLIALAVAGALGVGGYFVWREGQGRMFPGEVELGTVTLVSPAQEEVTLVATGYVYARKKATVAPKSLGRLAKLYVDEGDIVKADQVIAEVESADAQAQLTQLHADIAAAEAKVERARADVADADAKQAREDELLKKTAGTQAAFDDAKLRAQSAKASLRAAEADLRAVEARRQAASVTLENTKVRAPFSGTVLRKLSEVGEVQSPTASGGGFGVVVIATLDDLEVQADVAEAQFHKVKVGTPAEIILDAFPDKRFRGQVSDIRPTVDRSKASVTVKVKFVDESKGVLPDMAAKVSFLQHALGEAQLKAAPKLVAPADAIVQRGGQSIVWIVDEDHLRPAPVVTGAPVGGYIELKSGPSTGTRVVRHPSPELREGAAVKEKK